MSDKKEEKKVEPKPKRFCKDCNQYHGRTKMCNETKFVPRKGICQSFAERG